MQRMAEKGNREKIQEFNTYLSVRKRNTMRPGRYACIGRALTPGMRVGV